MSGKLQTDDIWTPASPLPDGRVLRLVVARCGQLWDLPEMPRSVRVGYNPRLRTTLGRASLDDCRVELNIHLLREHPDQLIPTLVHELAHVAVRMRYGASAAPHGREFRTLMAAAGLPAETTHDLPAAKALRRRRRRYVYLHVCGECGYSFMARSVRRDCYCTRCGPEMSWDVYRAADNPAGRKHLSAARKRLVAAVKRGQAGRS
ncbi:MAG: SprT-like domain-containing protein [Planctomycetota bacterium]